MGGNTKGYRRRFGAVRKLPSGRYQARYVGPDEIERTAPQTFTSKRDAEVWLGKKETEILGQERTDPLAGKIAFHDYAAAWMAERTLTPKTAQLYEGLLILHINPTLGSKPLAEITSRHVRQWHTRLVERSPGASTVAKAYRLLRAILNTAIQDDLIKRNPCQIKNAGVERPEERPGLTVPEVFVLAAAVPPRFRALVLLATFGSLRWGELAALRRHNLDLEARTVKVEASLSEMKTGELITGRPKSDAGARVVALPEVIIGDLAWHLQRFSEQAPDGLVFVGEKGAQLRRSNFTKVWAKALAKTGLPKIHIHDLRHTGNTLAAATGATLKELMTRMGHSSTKAATVYLHAAKDRDRAIADAMGEIVKQGLGAKDGGDDSPHVGAKIN
ncbi:site-specific integrase [Planotetraspora phitsanulokensis]|uniref:Putative prophage phiRv2 integrase n=1 Tax=Planotetraspora phitsanulokensis TaxID=575192 RepID=A0A8J3XG56_9ACTN|nr:site-specific integrase [Planotetraspora phitsanulokensis]GII39694.1 putative prophage phiRv2 integrase [Planotetraspora phitsanulokensis]